MTYTNTTNALVTPLCRHVDDHWVKSTKTNFMKKQIFARGANLILTPASFVTHCLDTIMGLGAGIGALCSGRSSSPLYGIYRAHFKNSRNIVSEPYVNFLRSINPTAKVLRGIEDGFLTEAVIPSFVRHTREWVLSKNFLKRHVATRLTFALLAVSCVISRLADGIIGVSAACLSILFIGRIRSLNHIAYRGLQFTGVVDDLIYCAVRCINPFSKAY